MSSEEESRWETIRQTRAKRAVGIGSDPLKWVGNPKDLIANGQTLPDFLRFMEP